jgi:DNA polymerase III delta prime subunit
MRELQIKSIKKFKTIPVYDLSVDGTHNFFVGNSKILTSNCDRLTIDAQSVMRNLMETYSSHTRFILTCNYQEKLIPAIKSRCQCFEIKPPSKKDCAGHLAKMLTAEKVQFQPQDVVFIVNSYFPDMRKIINFAQQSNVHGVLKIAKENTADMDYKMKLIGLLKTPQKAGIFTEVRQLIADASFSNYEEVYMFLYDRVNDYAPGKEALVIVQLAESSYQSALVFEREITFCAAMHKILKVLSK